MNGSMMRAGIVRAIRYVALSIAVMMISGGSSHAQLEWQPLCTVPSQHGLNSVCFLDADTGFIVGDMALVCKTTDGGLNWTKQAGMQPSFPVTDICFQSAEKGVVTNDFGSIFRTTNGGESWYEHWGLTTSIIHAVDFADSLVGAAVTGDGEILRTTDGGLTWDMLPELTRVRLLDISFFDEQYGIIVGARETILLSSDAGATWVIRQQGSCGRNYAAVSAIPDGVAFVVGGGGWVLHTTNRGIDWTAQTSGTGTGLSSVYCIDADNAYAVGRGGTLIFTTDGGARWERGTSGVLSNLHAVWFTDSSTGFIVGSSGTFIRTKRGGTTQRAPAPNTHSAARIQSVHPNPARTRSSIAVAVESADFVRLCVYDLYGRQVTTICEAVLPPGTHSFPWDAVELHAGVYFLILQSGWSVETRKIILQHRRAR